MAVIRGTNGILNIQDIPAAVALAENRVVYITSAGQLNLADATAIAKKPRGIVSRQVTSQDITDAATAPDKGKANIIQYGVMDRVKDFAGGTSTYTVGLDVFLDPANPGYITGTTPTTAGVNRDPIGVCLEIPSDGRGATIAFNFLNIGRFVYQVAATSTINFA